MIDFREWDRQLDCGNVVNWPAPVSIPYVKTDYEIKLEKYKTLLLKLQQEQNTNYAVIGDELSEEDKELCRLVNRKQGHALICFKGNSF